MVAITMKATIAAIAIFARRASLSRIATFVLVVALFAIADTLAVSTSTGKAAIAAIDPSQ